MDKRVHHHIMKSEGESRVENGHDMRFSIDDLEACPERKSSWEGVRNHVAKNNMRAMKKGDLNFFYHSNVQYPGIVAIVEVVTEAFPDHTQFDPKDPHYDAKAKKESPTWYMVEVKLVRRLKRVITLEEMKAHRDGALAKLGLFTHSRLSVSNVGDEEWNFLLQLENQTTDIGTAMDARIAVEFARKSEAKVSVKDKGVNKKAERDSAKRKVSPDDAGNGTAVKNAKK